MSLLVPTRATLKNIVWNNMCNNSIEVLCRGLLIGPVYVFYPLDEHI